MELTVQIPDDVVLCLSAAGGDLSRRALETLVAEEYKLSRLGLDRQAGLARWFHSDLDIDSR